MPTAAGSEQVTENTPPMTGSGIHNRQAAILGDNPKTRRISVAPYIILGAPLRVTANAPMLPEYEVTPQDDPINPAHKQAMPSIRIPRLTPSSGTGGAATIFAAAKYPPIDSIMEASAPAIIPIIADATNFGAPH